MGLDSGFRVLLDLNVLVSYLLNPAGTSPPVRIVVAAITGRFVMLSSTVLLEELRGVLRRPYFVARISEIDREDFIDGLSALVDLVAEPPDPLPARVRDPGDDYLLALAIAGGADVLVTGDRDLLVLDDTGLPVRIMTPAAFAASLESA